MIHCLLWVCNMDMKELIYNIIVARKTLFIWKYPLMVKLMQINSLWLKIAKKIFAENYFPFNTRQAMMPNAIAKEIYTPFLKVSETRKRIARFFNHCKVLRLLTSWNHCSGLVNIGFTRDLWKLESALTAYPQNELSFRHLEEYLTFTGFWILSAWQNLSLQFFTRYPLCSIQSILFKTAKSLCGKKQYKSLWWQVLSRDRP